MSIWLIRSRRSCGNLLKTLLCNGRDEHSVSCNPSASLFVARRYKSMKTAIELFSSKDDDAKQLLEDVEKLFGGNAATKRTQRNLLKQQYENFTASSSKMLDQTFDRLQKLVSQLELLDEKLS
nr:hypothetical protein [Tanacetum cinerariifolium]